MALTFTHNLGDGVRITLEDGREILVVVKPFKGERVRVSIEAPRTIAIQRAIEIVEPTPRRPHLDPTSI